MAAVMEYRATLTLCVFIVLYFCGEVLSNIDQDVNQENKESFVSLQKDNKHQCGGARLKPRRVLITISCKLLLGDTYSDISAVIPALPEDRRHGYKIENIKSVKETLFYIVILKLPESEKSQKASVAHLAAKAFSNGMEAAVIGWHEGNNTFIVKPANNIEYNVFSISVIGDLWTDLESFKNEYLGSLLFQNYELIGVASRACSSGSEKSTFFEDVYPSKTANRIRKAVESSRISSCFPPITKS